MCDVSSVHIRPPAPRRQSWYVLLLWLACCILSPLTLLLKLLPLLLQGWHWASYIAEEGSWAGPLSPTTAVKSSRDRKRRRALTTAG